MKTLIVTLEYPPQVGGIASYAYNLAAHLNPAETVVYAPIRPGAAEFDAKTPWKTYRLHPYWTLVWPHWWRLLRQLRRIVKAEKIEQIYLHHALPVGQAAYWLKKWLGVPFTVFLHGTDVEVGTRGKMKAKKFARVCREAQKVVVNSEFLKAKLLSKVENLSDVRVVYPCPGDAFFGPYDEGAIAKLRAQLALEGKKVILTVARMTDGKGYPHLVRILPQVLKKVPNLSWLIIGDGPKKEMIAEMIRKNDLQNVVRLLGNISYEQLPEYYRLADAFVLLTHKDDAAEEGWGTVFGEAAAAGLPVIAGRAGGVEEVVENLVTGILVDVYQDASVAAAITDLLRETEFARRMGEAGRERAAREFKWPAQIAKIERR